MKLNNLCPAPKSIKKRKRVGRGCGSGHGSSSCRGSNGQNSRSGGGTRPGFEGGQMPLQRRVPKYGFTNLNRIEYKGINISTLQELAEKQKLNIVKPETLVEAGLVSKKARVKILAKGSLEKKLEVHAHAFSKAAAAAIEAKQGKVVKID